MSKCQESDIIVGPSCICHPFQFVPWKRNKCNILCTSVNEIEAGSTHKISWAFNTGVILATWQHTHPHTTKAIIKCILRSLVLTITLPTLQTRSSPYIFGPLKLALCGPIFSHNEWVQVAVQESIKHQPTSLYCDSMHNLVKQCRTVLMCKEPLLKNKLSSTLVKRIWWVIH